MGADVSTATRPGSRRTTFHPLRVAALERLIEDAVAVTFDVPEELRADFAFEPGQHVTLRAELAGQDVRRTYSICWSRREALRRGQIRVASSRVESGLMSTWLHRGVSVGDVVEVLPPIGGFTCATDPASARHHVAVAAGSGITPVLSLLTTALEEEPASSVTLVLGNRRTSTVMFLDELLGLKDRYPTRVQLLHVLSREPQDAPLLSGRIDRPRFEALLDTLVPVESADEWYVCGPFGLVETTRAVLAERGADRRHVHSEIFHVEDDPSRPPPPTPPDPSAAAETLLTVDLDGRETTIAMHSREETILAATLRARPDAPYSCTGGVCGTCRARLVEGEVRMDRNFALEPEELAAGVVLACQSHPLTPTVRLDYDA